MRISFAGFGALDAGVPNFATGEFYGPVGPDTLVNGFTAGTYLSHSEWQRFNVLQSAALNKQQQEYIAGNVPLAFQAQIQATRQAAYEAEQRREIDDGLKVIDTAMDEQKAESETTNRPILLLAAAAAAAWWFSK